MQNEKEYNLLESIMEKKNHFTNYDPHDRQM